MCYNKLMDNNNYEQQFQQDLQNSMASQPTGSMNMEKSSKIPIIVAAVLGVIVLVETIFLVITMTNNSTTTEDEENYDEVVLEDEYVEDDGSYVYDEDDNLIALEVTCSTENGASFALTTDNKYSQYDASSNLTDSGTYSILESSIIPLTSTNASNQQKVLYFDGWILADGTTIYDCEEEFVEDDTEDFSEDELEDESEDN